MTFTNQEWVGKHNYSLKKGSKMTLGPTSDLNYPLQSVSPSKIS